jgi:GrpB-like predicted nucleotidyltransferase (UPF0157 family)
MPARIIVVPYREEWPQMFLEEAERLRRVFGSQLVSIQHVGSTAIPGMQAKPIIDILVEVLDINQVDGCNDEMSRLDYRPMVEYGIPGRRFFMKFEGGTRTCNAHIFQTGHADLEILPTLRDYLITHPDDAQAYARLKHQLADQFIDDFSSYTAAKTDFIQDMNRKAREWRQEQISGTV